MSRKQTRRAFSLIELVIVIVIIGIIAAIAVPRMSRGAAGANDAALRADLATLRSAIDLYQTEHEGLLPTVAGITLQLSTYSDILGNTQATKDATHIFGTYIRAIPAQPVGARKGQVGIAAADAAAIGWLYNGTTGAITANTTTETDDAGVLYNTY